MGLNVNQDGQTKLTAAPQQVVITGRGTAPTVVTTDDGFVIELNYGGDRVQHLDIDISTANPVTSDSYEEQLSKEAHPASGSTDVFDDQHERADAGEGGKK